MGRKTGLKVSLISTWLVLVIIRLTAQPVVIFTTILTFTVVFYIVELMGIIVTFGSLFLISITFPIADISLSQCRLKKKHRLSSCPASLFNNIE